MLTRYNFGAARDPEMLHKIYDAEPVAPNIEIPRGDIVKLGFTGVYIIFLFLLLNIDCGNWLEPP